MLLGFLVGAAIGVTTSAISQGIEYGWENVSIFQVITEGILGGISGALSMSPFGVGTIILVNMALSAVSHIVDAAIHDKTPSVGGLLLSIALGGLFAVAGGDGLFLRPLKNGTKKVAVKALSITQFSLEKIIMMATKDAAVSGGVNIIISALGRTLDWISDKLKKAFA
jgi:hypothetical protein